MDEQFRIICSKLPPMPAFYIPEQHPALIETLEKKLNGLLDQVDIINPQDPVSLDYCIARMIIQLLLYDGIDLKEFAHKLQGENGPFSDPLGFDAASRIIHDWCQTGGKKAAKIGYPLN